MLARDSFSILTAYLLGSLPFAYLVTRWRAGKDIRQVGVGNAGARNVWHVVGPGWAIAVGALDILKGALAINVAHIVGARAVALYLAGPVAILGHDFPIFRRFEGGKGVATAFGVLLTWMPEPTLISMVMLASVQLVLRNFDRSIVFGSISAIFLPLAFQYRWTMTAYALLLFLMLAVRQLHDLPHERSTWAVSGWKGVARTDWHGKAPGESVGVETTDAGRLGGSGPTAGFGPS